jgi:hypothetical protein
VHRHIRRALGMCAAVVFTVVVAQAQPLRINRSGQFWGTWVVKSQPAPGIAIPKLITYHLDSTITGTDSSSGMPNATTATGPLHGVWERTGWLSINGTALMFVFDPKTGVLIALARTRSSLEFAHDFNSFEGKMFLETLPCPSGPPSCPDPLAAGAQWIGWPGMPADGFPVSGTRLEPVTVGPLP